MSTLYWITVWSSFSCAGFHRVHLCPGGDDKSKVGIALRNQLNGESLGDVLEQLRRCPVGLETDLSKTISFGVAFHHAGLTMDERDIMEGAFKHNTIRVLVATSTLSSGVNLPARRVIVRSPHCHGFPIDILQYRQMIGRAGRMGVDTAGESYLICNESERRMGEEVATQNLPPIKSCLGDGDFSNCLKRALLEVVAGCVVCTTEDAFEYIKCTLLFISTGENFNENSVHQCIKLLIEQQFVRECDNKLTPTNLGQACLAASVTPEIGLKLIKELDKARQSFVLDSELHLLYLITPYSVSEQIGHLDWFRVLNVWEKLSHSMRKVGDIVGIEEGFIVKAMTGTSFSTSSDKHKLAIHRRFYTSLLLYDLINEVSINTVVTKYGTSKGLLQSLQQSSSTFAGMVTQFCKRLGWSSLELLISQFSERLQFGVQRQLIDLLRLDCLNSITARTLFNAGILNISELALADLQSVQRALSKAIPYNCNSNNNNNNISGDKEKQKSIWLAGRFALNEKEAALFIINEARHFLKRELGLKSASWVESKIGENDLDLTVNSVKIRPTISRDVTMIETSQENNNKSMKPLVNDTIQNLSSSSRKDSIDLFAESDCVNTEKNYKRESLDLFEETFEYTNFSISVHVSKKNDFDNLSNKSISDSYLAELISIKTPKEPEEKWDCNIGGESILELTQRDFGSKKRKREDDPQTKKDGFHNFLEPQLKLKKIDDPSTSYSKPTESCDLLEGTMFPDSIRIDTQLDQLLNNNVKTNATVNSISTELSKSVMELAFQNSFNSMSNTIISPKKCNIINMTCKDLVISDSEDMIAGSQDTISSGPSPHKESPLKPNTNTNSIQFNTWAYKTKIVENMDLFTRDHFTDIKRRKEITMALNVCKEFNITQKIGARVVRRNLENYKGTNVFKFDDRVLKGFAITWYKQSVVHYVNLNTIGLPGISLLKKLLSNKNLTVNIIDAKSSYKTICQCCNIRPVCKFRDPFVADWLINGQQKNSLENLIQWHLNFEGSVQTNDAVFNAFITQKLIMSLRHQLKQIYIYKTFKDIEMPIQIILAKMELYGFGLNKEHLTELNEMVDKLMKNISEQGTEFAGTKFNMQSTLEWAKVKKKLNITDCSLHPLVSLVKNWRKLSCLRNNHINTLLATKNDRVYCDSNTYSNTGRMSMHEPNLQNVPKDYVIENEIISIRSAFISKSNQTLVSVDFCQIELRVLAHLSKDPMLLSALNLPGDVFISLSSKWHKIPEIEVSDELRQKTKQVCYGLLYGMGALTLSETLNITEDEAQKLISEFKSTFSGVNTFFNECVTQCRSLGLVKTLSGRIRHLSDIKSDVPKIRSHAERQAINTVIQGSAADVTKMAMIKIDKNVTQGVFKSQIQLVMHLHDELIFEVSNSILDEACSKIVQTMESAVNLCVPLPVKLRKGCSWGDLK